MTQPASEANLPCLGDIIINASETMDQLKPGCAQRKGVNHGPSHPTGSVQTLGCPLRADLGDFWRPLALSLQLPWVPCAYTKPWSLSDQTWEHEKSYLESRVLPQHG